MRVCATCGAPDRLVGDGDSEHWVKPEIRYIADAASVTARDRSRGWNYRLFQGRPALERMQCVECLRRNAERDGFWTELRGKALELESSNDGGMASYFKALCD